MILHNFNPQRRAAPARPGFNDPQAAHPDSVLSIRAQAWTNNVLQSLVASEGLTFWGEAVNMILAFAFENPELFPFDRATFTDGDDLFSLGGARGERNERAAANLRKSRGILVAMDPPVMDQLNRVARKYKVANWRAASVIVHIHGRAIVATIQATRRGE